jgi:hypothetical protein
MLTLQVGSYIEPDHWRIGNLLRPGLEGFCQYYLPTACGGPVKEVAVNVEITGRKPRRRAGDFYLRVKITFVGDGEPDTTTGGWTPCDWCGEQRQPQ